MKVLNLLIVSALLIVTFINQRLKTTSSPPVLGTQDSKTQTFQVTKVIDGDTIDVIDNGQETRVRLIGVNTPETSDPRRPIECFGEEAKQFLTDTLTNQVVTIEADPTQSNRDQYDRLLRYVFVGDQNINLQLIKEGYGYEYTYDQPYQYQVQFKQAQIEAQKNAKGLWNPQTCNGQTKSPINTPTIQMSPNENCQIKGNISSREKIYHLPGCRDYGKTSINQSRGEMWFCTEEEALNAGWRKAGSC